MIDEKKLIEERPEWLNPDCVGSEEYNKGWNACNKYWCNTIKRQPKVGEWIPCSERLPEEPEEGLTDINECDEYIVMIENAKIPTAINYAGNGEWYRDGYFYDVIAWQPLPQPFQPRGE